MGKVITQEEFQRRMEEYFGDEYDFSESIYKGAEEYITYKCKKHGLITTKAKNLLNRQRCKQCAHTTKTCLVCDWGINDYDGLVNINGKSIESYSRWCGILERCLCVKRKGNRSAYRDCSVCDEWRYFSKFKEWFDNPENGHKEGYHINKDLFFSECNIYSPETCCFLPPEINSALTKKRQRCYKLPKGVQYIKNRNKYKAVIKFKTKKAKMLGYFNTAEEASDVYKKEKKEHLKILADEYYSQGLITERVYNALQDFNIETTD